jgi:histidinol-phosphate/aromatic aminotransferase/cobyric acid decarboxylase-like protein
MATEFMTRMLDHPEFMRASVQRTLEGKQYFGQAMRALGFGVLENAGNFLHVNFGEDGPLVHASLKGRVLYRTAFDTGCLAGFSRFSMAPMQVLEPVVGIIAQAMKGKM